MDVSLLLSLLSLDKTFASTTSLTVYFPNGMLCRFMLSSRIHLLNLKLHFANIFALSFLVLRSFICLIVFLALCFISWLLLYLLSSSHIARLRSYSAVLPSLIHSSFLSLSLASDYKLHQLVGINPHHHMYRLLYIFLFIFFNIYIFTFTVTLHYIYLFLTEHYNADAE